MKRSKRRAISRSHNKIGFTPYEELKRYKRSHIDDDMLD